MTTRIVAGCQAFCCFFGTSTQGFTRIAGEKHQGALQFQIGHGEKHDTAVVQAEFAS